MTSSFPRWVVRTVLAGTFLIPAIIQAQIPGGSSARTTPSEIEKTDVRVDQVITRAEDHFRKGKLNLQNSKREQARDEFDKAVDTILESGLDVRANQRLQTFYLELVERVYREEVPNMPTPQPNAAVIAQNANSQSQSKEPTSKQEQPAPLQIGFRQQQFEPSPLDELSKLILTPEELTVSPADIDDLEIAKNSVNFAFTTNPLIQGYINHYQGRGRATMESGLRKSGRYMKLARETFRKYGVPEDLVWLGQVESSWTPKAFSSAAASGLWQFVPSTGRSYGLRQTAYIDERNSFEKATEASAKYLKTLANHFNGDWALAMAAYNTGPLNVDRAIARAGGAANFWTIYPFLYQETRNYVPNILATILIAKNPEKYGFSGIRREPSLSYDVVQVPTATSLRLLADATDTSVDYLQSLNPELRRDVTPRGELYNVRVPAGRSKQLLAVLRRVPGDRRESARVISIAPGEDLQSVANRTGVSVAQLQALNPGVDLKTTTKLVAPNSNVRLTNWKRAKPTGTSEPAPAAPTKIRARKGDTIAKIAAARKVSAEDLARLNGVSVNAELKAGQEIRLPVSTATPTRQR